MLIFPSGLLFPLMGLDPLVSFLLGSSTTELYLLLDILKQVNKGHSL